MSEIVEEEAERYYYVGDWFYSPEMGYSILSQVAPHTFSLISIEDGNRVLDGIEMLEAHVEVPAYRYRLTLDDVKKLAGSYEDGLRKIERVKISILS